MEGVHPACPLYDGADDQASELGRGILRLTVSDLVHQLSTVQSVGPPDLQSRLSALAKFGSFFFGDLRQHYGPGRA